SPTAPGGGVGRREDREGGIVLGAQRGEGVHDRGARGAGRRPVHVRTRSADIEQLVESREDGRIRVGRGRGARLGRRRRRRAPVRGGRRCGRREVRRVHVRGERRRRERLDAGVDLGG